MFSLVCSVTLDILIQASGHRGNNGNGNGKWGKELSMVVHVACLYSLDPCTGLDWDSPKFSLPHHVIMVSCSDFLDSGWFHDWPFGGILYSHHLHPSCGQVN